MKSKSDDEITQKVQELQTRLEEAEQLILAIKEGEVDAFAIRTQNESEIYTLKSSDYAYRILIEEFGEGAINVTEEGLIVYTNKCFFEMLNKTYDQVIGSSIFDLINYDSLDEFKILFKESLSGKAKGEIYLQGTEKIPVYVSLTSLQPQLATVGIIITNLTEKKKNEQLILEYQKVLEQRNHDLLNSNAELSSFSHITSHDLQEPLRKIQIFATEIADKEYNNLSDRGKNIFHRIQTSANRMQTLIQDLLMYSKTSSEERRFENVQLSKIIEEIKNDISDDIDAKKGKLSITGDCKCKVIPFQIRQLIENLLRNSLKFSSPGRPLEIAINIDQVIGVSIDHPDAIKKKQYCHISIVDNGIGFDPLYKDKIFEIFQRLHSKEKFAGSGIGLSIVKKIVKNHNGIIQAESELGHGATFNIYLPTN